jgi:hypothetical protein
MTSRVAATSSVVIMAAGSALLLGSMFVGAGTNCSIFLSRAELAQSRGSSTENDLQASSCNSLSGFACTKVKAYCDSCEIPNYLQIIAGADGSYSYTAPVPNSCGDTIAGTCDANLVCQKSVTSEGVCDPANKVIAQAKSMPVP